MLTKEKQIEEGINKLLSSWACDPPVLRATAKTHKPPDKQGLPKSRPIVGASRGLTTPLGETLSDLIEPVAKARTKQWEAQATEEVLRKIQETNTKLEEGRIKDIVVGSLDVEALYPSIDQIQGPRIVAEEVMKSPLKFDNIDTHLLGVYLATVLTKERQIKEGISKLLPIRKAEGKRGRKPNIHGRELAGPKKKEITAEEDVQIGKKTDENEETEIESKWYTFYRQYTTEERKLLVAKVILVALETCFTNHIY